MNTETMTEAADVLEEQLRDILIPALIAITEEPDFAAAAANRGFRETCARDLEFHLAHLLQAVRFSEPDIYAHHATWTRELFSHLSLHPRCTSLGFELLHSSALKIIPRELHGALLPAIRACEAALIAPRADSNSNGRSPCEESNSSTFVELLLQDFLMGQARLGFARIEKKLQEGVSVETLYLEVLTPLLQKVGDLWFQRKISVGHEHYCTSAVQTILGFIGRELFPNRSEGRRAVLACVSHEQHSLGARMIADLLTQKGWQVLFLGANMPLMDLKSIVREFQPDAVALSTSILSHLTTLANMGESLHECTQSRPIPVIAGGRALGSIPDLWDKLGLDGYAASVGEFEEIISYWGSGATQAAVH